RRPCPRSWSWSERAPGSAAALLGVGFAGRMASLVRAKARTAARVDCTVLDGDRDRQMSGTASLLFVAGSGAAGSRVRASRVARSSSA
ncbi:MAG: hypothetical protein ACRDL8_07220, partial [Solirubrobacteraceae bacterium]